MNNLASNFSGWLQYALRMLVALGQFFHLRTGAEYGVALPSKIILLLKMIRSQRRINGSHDLVELLTLATALMNVPRLIEGCAVECGCSRGRAAVVLSLVCTLCNRRLELFPAPGQTPAVLEELRANVTRYGDITSCHIHGAELEQALVGFKHWCVFALVNVEQPAALDSCLRYLWPLLQERCPLFVPQARRVEFTPRFADAGWWQNNLQAAAPELAGAPGAAGYARKFGSI